MNYLKTFIYLFLRPKIVFRYYRNNELWRVSSSKDFSQDFHPLDLSLLEGILISYPFVLLTAIKDMVMVLLFIASLKYLSFLPTDFKDQYNLILMIIGFTIFYPFWTYVKLLFIDLLISGYALLFQIPFWTAALNRSVLVGTLCSKVMAPIPFLGFWIDKILFFYYWYLGLRYKLGFRRHQAIVVVLTPFLILIGFILLEAILDA